MQCNRQVQNALPCVQETVAVDARHNGRLRIEFQQLDWRLFAGPDALNLSDSLTHDNLTDVSQLRKTLFCSDKNHDYSRHRDHEGRVENQRQSCAGQDDSLAKYCISRMNIQDCHKQTWKRGGPRFDVRRYRQQRCHHIIKNNLPSSPLLVFPCRCSSALVWKELDPMNAECAERFSESENSRREKTDGSLF